MLFAALILLGLSAGLRTFTPVAVVALALNVAAPLEMQHSPLSFVGSNLGLLLFGMAAIGEYVFDLLPFAPPRTETFSLAGRVIMGTFASDRKSTRLNSSHTDISRMPSSA